MKIASKLIALALLGLATLLGGGCDNQKENTKMDTIYQFTAKGRNGTSLDLASLKGKVLLIVNTATGCGFTPQYAGLEKLYAKYHDKGLEILDIPCNQFAGQTPGDDDEIHEFCTLKYKTQFPQMKKSDVNGDGALELYKFLKSQQGFKGFGKGPKAMMMDVMLKKIDKDYKNNAEIKWNFTKFLVDRSGAVIARFEPMDDMKKIDAAIAEVL